MLVELQLSGNEMPVFHLNGNTANFQMFPTGDKSMPSVEFNSYDDLNNIAGIEGPALGKIELVHIEEPVAIGKVPPTQEE